MIKLDLDIIFLTNRYDIGAKKLCMMGHSNSIKDIMEEEADSGNKKAANFEKEVFQDRSILIEAFRLAEPANRYIILSNLNPTDLKYFLYYLKPQELALGMKFFTKEKILSLLQDLPQEKLYRILRQVFSIQNLVALIPEDDLNKFIDSESIEKPMIMEQLAQLPPAVLQKMIETMTGQPTKEMPKGEMLKTINAFPPKEFKEGVKALDAAFKAQIIAGILEHDDSLISEFSSKALTEPFKMLEKPEIIQAIGQGLEVKDLVPLLQDLPPELLAMVATQIDPNDFAALLIQNFQNVLAEIALQ